MMRSHKADSSSSGGSDDDSSSPPPPGGPPGGGGDSTAQDVYLVAEGVASAEAHHLDALDQAASLNGSDGPRKPPPLQLDDDLTEAQLSLDFHNRTTALGGYHRAVFCCGSGGLYDEGSDANQRVSNPRNSASSSSNGQRYGRRCSDQNPKKNTDQNDSDDDSMSDEDYGASSGAANSPTAAATTNMHHHHQNVSSFSLLPGDVTLLFIGGEVFRYPDGKHLQGNV